MKKTDSKPKVPRSPREKKTEEEPVNLESPTSVKMKQSFLLKQANEQFETLINQIKRKKGSAAVSSVFGVQTSGDSNMMRQQGRRPAARDGHTGVLHEDLFVVFGGDRHHMPFNDMFCLDIASEFEKQHQ